MTLLWRWHRASLPYEEEQEEHGDQQQRRQRQQLQGVRREQPQRVREPPRRPWLPAWMQQPQQHCYETTLCCWHRERLVVA
jgi:hypothetical protein